MKIFITGGTGFIGKHVVKQLANRQHELMLLVRDEMDVPDGFADERLKFINGDLSNTDKIKGLLKDLKPDATLHMAWEGLPDYGMEMSLRNLRYGQDLFAAAAKAGCECIVSIGSCWEYKKIIGGLTESSEIEFSRMFPAVKNSLCLIGQAVCNEHNMQFYWPRVFFVYGPGQRDSSLIPSIIRSFRNGDVPEISNPNNKNDFVYVEDAADAIVRILERRPEKTVYNIGSGISRSVYEVASVISEIMGCRLGRNDMPEKCPAQPDDNFWADISIARNDLGWSPKHCIIDGIKETVNYFAGSDR